MVKRAFSDSLPANSVYTNSPDFIEAIEFMVGVTYFLQAPEDTLCWLKSPVTLPKAYQYNGQVRTKKVLSGKSKAPISFKSVATGINDFWDKRKVSEGAKSPIEYEFTKRRIVLSHEGIPSKTIWLLIRRTPGNEPHYSYFYIGRTCQYQDTDLDLAKRTSVVQRAMHRGDKD